MNSRTRPSHCINKGQSGGPRDEARRKDLGGGEGGSPASGDGSTLLRCGKAWSHTRVSQLIILCLEGGKGRVKASLGFELHGWEMAQKGVTSAHPRGILGCILGYNW